MTVKAAALKCHAICDLLQLNRDKKNKPMAALFTKRQRGAPDRYVGLGQRRNNVISKRRCNLTSRVYDPFDNGESDVDGAEELDRMNGMDRMERLNGVNGGSVTTRTTATEVAADADVWYDVQAQLDGSSVIVYLGTAETGMKKWMQATTNLGTSTAQLRVSITGLMPFEFDNFRILSRSVHQADTSTFTYNDYNQLTAVTNSGVTWNNAYDYWGRLSSSTTTIGQTTYTRTYTYWFGDKLKEVASDFPGEKPVVSYLYDGLGKRRWRTDGTTTTYWRWDAGYSVLTQYEDATSDWDFGDLKRCFVPFGHTALAETDVDGSGNPATAAYTYLALDHLGSGRYGYNQSKSSVSAYRHLPFGQRFGTPTGTAPYHEYTGKPWDADTKLYYFPYRYYSTAMNRWLGPDPAGLVDGPNVYGYVKGIQLII